MSDEYIRNQRPTYASAFRLRTVLGGTKFGSGTSSVPDAWKRMAEANKLRTEITLILQLLCLCNRFASAVDFTFTDAVVVK